MKKQIFTLLLSAAIFTTNPLFAMEPREEHSCLTCTKIVKYPLTDTEQAAGKGALHKLQDDNIVSIISELTLPEVISTSYISKYMYNLYQTPLMWASLADKEKEKFLFPPISCPKNRFQTAYVNDHNLFSDNGPYPVPFSSLRSLKFSSSEEISLLLSKRNPTWHPRWLF